MMSLDMLMALAVLATLVSLSALYASRLMDQQDYRIAADQQSVAAEALSKYLKDNFAVVLTAATPTQPAQITIAMLRNAGYLPTGFSATNQYGQTLVGLARRVSATSQQLESVLLTTGGSAISEMGIRSIAEALGGPGGFVSETNPAVIQGIRGGWELALSNYAISPGAGHTASALFLMDGQLANDYLYRNAVPGHAELNTMNTAINMGGNDVNDAGAVSAEAVTTTGRITSTGRLSTDEFLSVGGIAEEGESCDDNTLLAKSPSGVTLSCQSGAWVGAVGDTAIKASNGETRLSSGIIIRWGGYTGTTSKTAKWFWSSFPTAVVAVLSSCSTGYDTINNYDLTGFNSNSNQSGGACRYTAIGW